MDEKLRTYLLSEDWLRRSKIFKQRKNYTCEICKNHILLEVLNLFTNEDHPSWHNRDISRFAETILQLNGDKEKLIHSHHRSYRHLGFESYGEISVLCKPCHTYVHENTNGANWEKAWEKTVNKVQNLLTGIHNEPDGKKEFKHIRPEYGQVMLEHQGLAYERAYQTEHDLELEEVVDDYFTFTEDYFKQQEEFE